MGIDTTNDNTASVNLQASVAIRDLNVGGTTADYNKTQILVRSARRYSLSQLPTRRLSSDCSAKLRLNSCEEGPLAGPLFFMCCREADG